MADDTQIEWTDMTWNIVTGCSVTSPGCTHCYAMKLAGTRLREHPSREGLTRPSAAGPVWTGAVRFNEQWLLQPLALTRARRIFVCAHGDLFHESVPDGWIDQVFAVMALAPWHTFQLLTKRAARMQAYLTAPWRQEAIAGAIAALPLAARSGFQQQAAGLRVLEGGLWPLPNVWLGVSVEDQQRAEERIPPLLQAPAAVRWISAEPLLGPVGLWPEWLHTKPSTQRVGLDWVVVGGESGQGARPMHPNWARALRDQCAEAGVAFLFKQWGSHSVHEVGPGGVPTPNMPMRLEDVHVMRPGDRSFTRVPPSALAGEVFQPGNAVAVRHARKKAIGRELDGALHDAYPPAAAPRSVFTGAAP